MKITRLSENQRFVFRWWTARDLSDYDGIICDGAVRSGKTFCLSASFMTWAMTNFDECIFGLCSKTIVSLKRNILPALRGYMKAMGMTAVEVASKNYMDVSFCGRKNRFYYFGGRDEGSPSLIQGVTLAGVLLDEAALMPRSFIEQAVARCSVAGSKLWFNCNPDNPYHWFKKEWIDKGFVDEPVAKELDLKSEIRELCRKKNAVIMAHYYTEGIIQDLADFVGDSLALAQKAAKTEADIIVMCGVHFMGETNKILCPDKKVLVPDLNATCSLAESCPADEFSRFVSAHPDHTVISYVNTTAATKAVTDVVVTSSNARQIVESFPSDEKIIFGPDRNLGNYINSVTGRDMLLWDGACHVHEKFSVEKILELKKSHPEAKVLAHPECKGAVLKLADVVGSTAALLKYAICHEGKEFIVATESGILHEMQKACPEKTFIPAPPDDSTCACNECNYMRLITLEKLYNTLKYEWPEIVVDAEVAEKAVKPIHRMLEISEKLGL